MNIVVSKSDLESTAKKIDSYVNSMASQNSTADSAVRALEAQWKGTDTDKFLVQWNSYMSKNSANGQMKDALSSYASLLRYAKSQYETAQYNAVKKARKIDHWFS